MKKGSGKKGSGWIILLVVVGLLYCYTLGQSNDNNGLDTGSNYYYGDDDWDDTDFDDDEELDDFFHNGGWSKYAQLDSTEKAAYKKLYEVARTGGTECTVVLDYDNLRYHVERVLLAVCDDHPELFWLNSGCTFRYSQKSGLVDVEIELGVYEYLFYKMDMQRYIDRLNDKVDAIVAKANAYSTDYEKALYVHDYLVKNSFYAHDLLAETEKTSHDSKCEIIRSAYSCLVEGETVCAGYAKAFKIVLDRLGINNMYVTGDAPGPHAWSCVELDGESYLFDLTWDDPVDGPALFIGHSYCGITDRQISFSHETDESLFRYPNCNEDRYEYFSYNGLRFDTYDLDAIADYAQANATEAITIAFSNADAYNDAVEGLVENSEWTKLGVFGEKKVKYIVSKGAMAITFMKA